MNIELLDMTRLTLLAKAFIQKSQVVPALAESSNVSRRLFRFASQGEGNAFATESWKEWLEELSRRGAEDFKLIMHEELDTFEKLDRVNGIPCCIICFYHDRATSWNKLWSYDPVLNKWDVQLVEIPVAQMYAKPVFKDVSVSMATLLERIRALAQKLKLSEFSFSFASALKALQADLVSADIIAPVNRRLLQAATEAYVFGGKGSWTDTAKSAAEAKGLSDEYETLTRELYRGIALSIMFAVNEW